MEGQRIHDKGEILTAEPEERLGFSHWSPLTGTDDTPENYHVVDIAFGDENGNTNVTLAQSNLEGRVTNADRASRSDYEKNWTTMLDGLRSTAER